MIKTIYNIATGKILNVSTRPDDANLPPGIGVLPVKSDPATQYVVNGEIQDMPPAPEDASNYEFNYETKTWQLKPVIISADTERNRRTMLLGDVDRVSATRYASLTAEQQQELQQYRQALLDVPQQVGFPINIDWPVKPAWL